MLRLVLITLFFASAIIEATDYDNDDYLVGIKQIPHRTEELTTDQFLQFSRLSDTEHLHEAVRHIMVPRVVGTENHKKVREYIAKSLTDLEWTVDMHKFHDVAPILGKLHFHNIIATLNPNAERYLVLACHYDSKYMPGIEFVGATDSAVPCAMLLNLAHVLHNELHSLKHAKVSLMFIFFDGEEAFENWGPTDSIYGARHLAREWEEQDKLKRIDILVLLDLLGAPDPKFYSFNKNTEAWYMRFISLEDRLSNAGLMERYVSSGVARHYPNRYFQPNALRSSLIEDDHIPFLHRGVPVLHLIPIPFPTVWHTKDDNGSVIDYATTENIASIVRLFALEYLLNNMTDTNKA